MLQSNEEQRGARTETREQPETKQTTPAPAPFSGGVSLGALATRLILALLSGLFVVFITLPLIALLLQAPFGSLLTYLGSDIVLDALKLTAISSFSSLALIILFCTPVAYVLGRRQFRGKRVFETLLEAPLILPPAVAGVALLFAFGRRTLVAGFLREFNIEISFTIVAVILAQTFVAAPFFIKSARTGFQSVPNMLLEAAATQGAGPWATARYILIPLAMPSLAGGAVLGWARAVGEFGATILFAGNFQGRTQTMPLAIYIAMESDINSAIVLSAILVISSFTVLLVFKLLSGRSLDVLPE